MLGDVNDDVQHPPMDTRGLHPYREHPVPSLTQQADHPQHTVKARDTDAEVSTSVECGGPGDRPRLPARSDPREAALASQAALTADWQPEGLYGRSCRCLPVLSESMVELSGDARDE